MSSSRGQPRIHWLWFSAVTLFLTVLSGAVLAHWAWQNLGVELALRDQPATVSIEDPLSVGIDIVDDLDIEMDTEFDTRVPINQRINVPVDETLDVDVTFDNRVPIEMDVALQETIPIDHEIPVDSEVEAQIFGVWFTMPVHGDIPVQADVPIDVTVPVEQEIDLAFEAPAKVRILDELSVPLDTEIDTTIPLQTRMQVPVRSRIDASAQILQPADLMIDELDLHLPVRELNLSVDTGTQQ